MRRRGWTAVAVIAAAVPFSTGALFAARSTSALSGGAPRTHLVDIVEFRFEPPELVVAVGDTIRWINRDPVPHTATARDSSWNTDRIEAGGQRTIVVRADATRDYFCVHHPTMTGTLRIIEALSPD